MRERVAKLLSVSSTALANPSAQTCPEFLNVNERVGKQLIQMLTAKNGFYAFESALHVLPFNCSTLMDIERWNDPKLWRGLYAGLENEIVFFAEDIFANQFGVCRQQIYRFEPETGKTHEMALDLEEWAGRILDDYEYETGHSLAGKWQELNGPLPPGMRLFPKIPFVLGGDYSVENLFALDAIEGLRYLAEICQQVAEFPDGTPVQLRVVNSPK